MCNIIKLSNINEDNEKNDSATNNSATNNSATIPVLKLLENNYLIPDYQRGYRWDADQVNDLLSDLENFYLNHHKENNLFYCMQSLILKADEKDVKKVIDGQQRLTTMYILVSYLKMMSYKWGNEIDFSNVTLGEISYQSREKTGEFLRKVSEDHTNNAETKYKKNAQDNYNDIAEEYLNRDISYMKGTYDTIKNCFEGEGRCPTDCAKHIAELISKGKVKFIVQDYTNEQYDENTVFKSINVGQIPLTDAELIRARLLLKTTDQDTRAKEWDNIEKTLQNDSFWYFISNEEDGTASRINLLFNLVKEGMVCLAKENPNEDSNEGILEYIKNTETSLDKHSLYRFLINYRCGENGKIKKGDTFEKEDYIKIFWRNVEEYFDILSKWYGDIEIYNYIGQVLRLKGVETIDVINKYKESKTRYDFIEYLKGIILASFGSIDNIWPVQDNATQDDGAQDDDGKSKREKIIEEANNNYKTFNRIWYSGRSETKEDKKKAEKKKDEPSIENKEIVHNFLLWSNCEYLNRQLHNFDYDMRIKLEKKRVEKGKSMRSSLTYEGEIQSESYRFPFYIYKTNKPDIEHIDSYIDATDYDEFFDESDKCDKWLRQIVEVLTKNEIDGVIKQFKNNSEIKAILGNDEKKIEKVIEAEFDRLKGETNKKNESIMFSGENLSEEDLKVLYKNLILSIQLIYIDETIEKTPGIDNHFLNTAIDRRKIGNLALLDANTNRGYGNSPFRVKRRDVIEKSQYGRYMYPCTKMVFLKEFDSKAVTLTNWEKRDFENYRKYLIELFYDCFYIDQKKTDKKLEEEIKNGSDLREIEFEYREKIISKDDVSKDK